MYSIKQQACYAFEIHKIKCILRKKKISSSLEIKKYDSSQFGKNTVLDAVDMTEVILKSVVILFWGKKQYR